MSYSSRVYRQRNAHMHDESKQKSFFAGHETKKPTKKNKQVQAKLAINKPGDSFEKEADAVANVVTNQPLQKPAIEQKKISSVQRLSTPAEEEKLGTNDARMKRDKDIQEKPIQAKDEEKKEKPEVQKMDEPEKEKPEVQKAEAPEKQEEEMKKPESVQKMDEPEKEKPEVQKAEAPEKKEEEMKKPESVQKMDEPEKEKEEGKSTAVQAKHEASGTKSSQQLSSRLDQSAGKGNSLPVKTLKEMSSRFGIDFSKVRVHTDEESVSMNKELEAQAFTHGEHIYFNEGKFDPDSAAGKFLLAHELTHVVQQDQKGEHQQVNLQPVHPAPTQPANITTPLPADAEVTPTGDYELTLGDARVLIRRDIHSKKKGHRAKTNFTSSGGIISDIKTSKGKITSFSGPTQLVIIIKTTYQRQARKSDDSIYGRGTTPEDVAAGATSLGFHEGSHGTNFIEFLKTNSLPQFNGTVGMSVKQFKKEKNAYKLAKKRYFRDMTRAPVIETDCVGTTIDEATGSKTCVP